MKKDKTIKISPQMTEHDLSYRKKQAKQFIDKGHKVKFEMIVHGRSRYMGVDYLSMLKSRLSEFKPINTWSKSHKYYLYTNKYENN